MKTPDYASMDEHQIRVAIAKLGIAPKDLEHALNEAVSAALTNAQTETLRSFGLSSVTTAPTTTARTTTHTAKVSTPATPATPGASGVRSNKPTKSLGNGNGNGNGKTHASPSGKAAAVKRPALSRANAGHAAGSTKLAPADKAASRALQGVYIATIRRVPKSRRKPYLELVAGPGGRAAAIDAINRDYPKQSA